MELFSKLKTMKIMLIDDDDLIRNALTFFFEEEGCRLIALETAEEGLLRMKEEPLDIVICDYGLSGMNGLQFLKHLHAVHPETIRVLITGFHSPEIVQEAACAGVDAFIQKPLSTKTIEDTLSRLLTGSKAGQGGGKSPKQLCASFAFGVP